MTEFEIWTLIFAGITASGVVGGIVVSIFKFFYSKHLKVNSSFKITKLHKVNSTYYIAGYIDLVNETNFTTSIQKIELVFNKKNIIGTVPIEIIPNIEDETPFKNLILSPFQSATINYIRFACPEALFQPNARLKIITPQRKYMYPISFQEHVKELE
jgi:hypothetical protein